MAKDVLAIFDIKGVISVISYHCLITDFPPSPFEKKINEQLNFPDALIIRNCSNKLEFDVVQSDTPTLR